MLPRATYRLQLRAGLDFEEVARLSDYVSDLGISHVYLSPIFKAVDGSTHGYDAVDPRAIDPALGGDLGYTRMISALRDHELGLLIDIVPNHMATAPENPWWWGVLASGPSSRYARFFDIDWEGRHDASWSKVLAPILGDHYGRVLENHELELAREGVRFEVRYHEHRLPLSPDSVGILLSTAAHRSASPELAGIADQLRQLPTPHGDTTAALERHRTVTRLEDELLGLIDRDSAVAAAVDHELNAISRDLDRLHELLDQQNYRLAYWRTANEEIDYRRFFSIETLVGVRAEQPDVFDETHGLIVDLVRDGSVDGLRVDHVDGIRDPKAYLDLLSTATGSSYTVVEKILEEDEALPRDWPVHGTTGYDFLNRVNSVFVDPGSERKMTEIYEAVTGDGKTYADVLHESKKHILDTSLAAETQNLTATLAQLCSHRLRHRDHTRRVLRDTLTEVIASFPVYRAYVGPGEEPSPADRAHIEAAVDEASQRAPDLDSELLELIADLTLGRCDGDAEADFTRRFQQLTAPVMAKGAEDTAFYRYNRLLSLNEVGGDPGRFGIDIDTFHERTAAMGEDWPRTQLTIATHDTKRSADVRARLNVLAEIPGEWESAVTSWMEMNETHRTGGVPDANTEYHLYQSLVGAWPIGPDRLRAYMEKAVREAKTHTSWMSPDADYESAVEEFVTAVLDDERFVAAVDGFIRDNQLVARGRRNSLRQVAMLLTCPGVPDVYQGSELWDLSLVDPDNRRPVDYDLRRQLLTSTRRPDWTEVDNRGDTKLWLTRHLLQQQSSDTGYEPVEVTGRRAGDIVAYRRGDMVAVIPVRSEGPWTETGVRLASGTWQSVLTGERVEGGHREVAALLGEAPLAVLVGDRH